MLKNINIMARNTNCNTRKGAVKDRTQVLNPKTKLYIKRDKKTGKFISAKVTPYKGITKEKATHKIKSK